MELLVEAGESSAEQYELLRWVRCLSPQGLADRAGVLALLDDVAREAAVAARSPGQPITGGPTLPQIQVGALRSAGYLDEAGCAQFDAWPGERETVSRIVTEAQATLRRLHDAADGAGRRSVDLITCRTCGRQVPSEARYCGYCGIRV
ncbi:MAG: zinc ribbon domain-containing protein [Chloroflexi bacterium]|nr:zinc ribbon domain-containing protein [Chloroflexota bacterium]